MNNTSIHFMRIPEYDPTLLDDKIEEVMRDMISVIELGRKLRENKKIQLKKPVSKLVVIHYDKVFLDNLAIVENYIQEELNANEIEYVNDEKKYIKLNIKPNFEVVYKRCKEIKDTMFTENKMDDPTLKKEDAAAKKEANDISALLKQLSDDEIRAILDKKSIKKNDNEITLNQVLVEKKFLSEYDNDKVFVSLANADCGIRINTETNEDILNSYYCREIINKVQKMRKESGIQINDDIVIVYETKEEKVLKKVCEKHSENIYKALKVPFKNTKPSEEKYKLFKEGSFDIGEEKDKETISITIYKA